MSDPTSKDSVPNATQRRQRWRTLPRRLWATVVMWRDERRLAKAYIDDYAALVCLNRQPDGVEYDVVMVDVYRWAGVEWVPRRAAELMAYKTHRAVRAVTDDMWPPTPRQYAEAMVAEQDLQTLGGELLVDAQGEGDA